MCGRPHNRFQITPLVVGGTSVRKGAWPWLAAVFYNRISGLSFICGGTLVSPKIVVSAAHCFKTSDETVRTNEIIIYLGRYNILRWMEEGSQPAEVEQIIVHSEYMKNETSYDADVALIILKKRVQYSEYIRPICLWNGPNDINEIIGSTGTVVGWGRDGSGNMVSAEPQKISLPVVAEATCLRASDTFRYITSERTFCAGAKNGRGPCNGDSGSGMTMLRNNRWVLRGIVSASLADPVLNSCNLAEYVVFTDMAKFDHWIRSYVALN